MATVNTEANMVRIQQANGTIQTAHVSQLDGRAREYCLQFQRRNHRTPLMYECKFGVRCAHHPAGGCNFIHFPLRPRLEQVQLPQEQRPVLHQRAPAELFPRFPWSARSNQTQQQPQQQRQEDESAKYQNDPNYVRVRRAATNRVEYIHIDRIDGRTVGGATLKLKQSDHAAAQQRRNAARSSFMMMTSESGNNSKPEIVNECKASAENRECVLRSCVNIHLLPLPPSNNQNSSVGVAAAAAATSTEESTKNNHHLLTSESVAVTKTSAASRCSNKIAPPRKECMFCCEDLSGVHPPAPPPGTTPSSKSIAPNSNDDDEQEQSSSGNNKSSSSNNEQQPLIVFQQKFVCARGHSICSDCITRTILEMWSVRSTAIKEESGSTTAAVLEVPEFYCQEADCDTPALTPAQIAKAVNDDEAINAFIETQQRARDAITLHKANERVQ